jgi:hypothetical protein
MKFGSVNLRATFAAAWMFGVACAGAASAAEESTIQIVKALYGPPGAANPRDFSVRLQQTCGEKSGVCESYCSKALVGVSHQRLRPPFSAPPVCRVIFRCGESETRATEADSNETLVLSCRDGR